MPHADLAAAILRDAQDMARAPQVMNAVDLALIVGLLFRHEISQWRTAPAGTPIALYERELDNGITIRGTVLADGSGRGLPELWLSQQIERGVAGHAAGTELGDAWRELRDATKR